MKKVVVEDGTEKKVEEEVNGLGVQDADYEKIKASKKANVQVQEEIVTSIDVHLYEAIQVSSDAIKFGKEEVPPSP